MSTTLPRSQRYMRVFASSAGTASGVRRCVADLLWLWRYRGLLHSRVPPQTGRYRRYFKGGVQSCRLLFWSLLFQSTARSPRNHLCQDGRFFLQGSPRQYDIITGEPPPPKVAGSVNLYTEEFFSLMNNRLKEGGIATFWLPVDQLKVSEAKAILRAFRNAFPSASVWAGADEEWIIAGHQGASEVPEQLGALFLTDGEEIDRITEGIAPLTDFYPKRLSDEPWDEPASHRFASTHMLASSAMQRFLGSPMINKIWPPTLNKLLQSYFIVRETRYFSRVQRSEQRFGRARPLPAPFPLARSGSGNLGQRRIPTLHCRNSRAQFRNIAAGNNARPGGGSIFSFLLMFIAWLARSKKLRS